MAGYVNIPKFKDVRKSLKTHPTLKFPKLSLKGKTTIAIHHSLTKQGLGGSNAESYAKYHVDTHGWPGIGYSYVIEPDGTVKFCNDIELRTYHVGDHNNYAVGICLTGDFRTEEPTDAQKESLRNLVGALQSEYPHLKHIKGHNEFSGYAWKQCPMFDYKAVLANKSVSKPKSSPKSKPKPSPVKKPSKTPDMKTNSIVDYLVSIGEDSSFANRKKLAEANGIKNYTGTAAQNTKLLQALRGNGAVVAPKKEAKPKKETLYLPKSASSWRVYPTNKAPVKGNEKGFLNPKKFGGLQYEVLAKPQAHVVTIQTKDFGKVNIYVHPSTGAVIK